MTVCTFLYLANFAVPAITQPPKIKAVHHNLASLPFHLPGTKPCKLQAMQTRHLFLVGYDISENPRRRRALRDVQHHALGGQKSFYECWLNATELQALLAQLKQRIDGDTDRVVLIRLDARTQSLQLGQAEPINSADFFHIA